MAIEEHSISNISELLGIVNNRYLWWRGESKEYPKPLTANIYREKYRSPYFLSQEFIRRAKTTFSTCPGNDDWVSWLFLMQHYGLPTHLLDWSSSPLVALFFVLEQNDSDKGILWGLNPHRLSLVITGKEMVYTSIGLSNTYVNLEYHNYLFQYYFNPEPKKFNQWDRIKNEVLPIHNEWSNIRHFTQQSCFTLHMPAARNLIEIANEHNIITKITVQKSDRLIRELDTLGINRATIFPDFENIARHIKGIK